MTFKAVFQNGKKKDIGLIVSEEMYRCPTFTGVCASIVWSVYTIVLYNAADGAWI